MSTFVYLYRQIDLLAAFADPEPGTYRDPEFIQWAKDELQGSIDRAFHQFKISPYQHTKLQSQLDLIPI